MDRKLTATKSSLPSLSGTMTICKTRLTEARGRSRKLLRQPQRNQPTDGAFQPCRVPSGCAQSTGPRSAQSPAQKSTQATSHDYSGDVAVSLVATTALRGVCTHVHTQSCKSRKLTTSK
jgi:hypothetical protein